MSAISPKLRQYMIYGTLAFSLLLVVPTAYQILQRPKIQLFHANQLFQNGHFEEATEWYRLVLSSGLETPTVLNRLADAYLARREFALAIPIYTRLIQLDPNDLKTMLKLAELYVLQQNTARAIGLIENVLQRRPDWRLARVAHARVLTIAGRFDEAIADYCLILHISPEEMQ